MPLLALAVALAVFTWSRKLTRLLFLLLAFLILVSLGPVLYVGGSRITGLPWAHLWSLPIVRSAWPVRFMLFSFLVLAVMVALWLAGPSKRRWARWLLGLLAIASVVVSTPDFSMASGANLPAFIATGEYRHYLAPGDTVVVVSRRGNAGMLWQAETNFYMRLAGGYINGAITPHSDLPPPVARWLMLRGRTSGNAACSWRTLTSRPSWLKKVWRRMGRSSRHAWPSGETS